ncbi:MAG TPA: tRNA uridine-5-carboxymethylaminomethyl(34) synthesis enzyme MnmG, partial [Ruminococcaceae bacterium]|nr:tRNA uridine-5-carboxymethylaminomethyl(34) synthesis enzyme MnmG [Oscillospiraceae bacterium]
MATNVLKTADVAVIGTGHAGCEAALVSARLGCDTVVFTMNLDSVANMPCNPSVGGTAKGHLVREIDALGGEMAHAADACCLQSRMLNRGKGPAVHSLRMQIDRRAYGAWMKRRLERQPRLSLIQAEIVDIIPDGQDGWRVITRLHAEYRVKAVILATGTYLGGRIYVGDVNYEAGPDGLLPANRLGEALKRLGLPMRRFKTGTPARVNRRSIDFSGLERQEGDEPPCAFSYDTPPGFVQNKEPCHIAYTNETTKAIILENLHRSPLYSG